jgi:hypothetical protein
MQHLASSSTTNSQNPEFPWQGQPYRRHAQASTSKVKKINGIQRRLCYLYIRTDVKSRMFVKFKKMFPEILCAVHLKKLILR